MANFNDSQTDGLRSRAIPTANTVHGSLYFAEDARMIGRDQETISSIYYSSTMAAPPPPPPSLAMSSFSDAHLLASMRASPPSVREVTGTDYNEDVLYQQQEMGWQQQQQHEEEEQVLCTSLGYKVNHGGGELTPHSTGGGVNLNHLREQQQEDYTNTILQESNDNIATNGTTMLAALSNDDDKNIEVIEEV